MRKLFFIFLLLSLIFLECSVENKKSDDQKAKTILIGIISGRDMSFREKEIKEALATQKHSPFAWISLLGEDDKNMEQGIDFLAKSNCRFIASGDTSLVDSFERASQKYPHIYFVLIDASHLDLSGDNFLYVNSANSLINLCFEKVKDSP